MQYDNVARSFGVDFWTIAKALGAMDTKFGKVHDWHGTGDLAQHAKVLIALAKKDVGALNFLVGTCDFDYNAINAFAESKGFGRPMEAFPNNGQSVGMFGGLKYNGLYHVPGEPDHVTVENKTYDAVKLSANDHQLEIYDWNNEPLVATRLQTGDILLITPDVGEHNSFTSLAAGCNIAAAYNARTLKLAGSQYDDVIVPQLNIPDNDTDIKFMVGMSSGEWTISRAKQKALFQLGVRGVKVEVKTTLVATRGMSGFGKHKTLIIDRPYLAVIVSGFVKTDLPIAAVRGAMSDWASPDVVEDRVAA